MPNPKYYEVLGLKPGAGEAEIKRAYKKLALEHHPDRNLGNEKSAQEKFVKIQAAHDALLNPSEHQTSVDGMYTETPDDVPSTTDTKPSHRRPKATSTKDRDGEPHQRRTRAHSRQNYDGEPYNPFQHPHFDPYKPFQHPIFAHHDHHRAQPDFWKNAFEEGFEPGGSPYGHAQPHSYSRKDEHREHRERERSGSRDKTRRKYPPSPYPQNRDSNGANRSFEDAMDGINIRINRVHITVDNHGSPGESSRSSPRYPPLIVADLARTPETKLHPHVMNGPGAQVAAVVVAMSRELLEMGTIGGSAPAATATS